MSRTERLRHDRRKDSPRYTDSACTNYIVSINASRIYTIIHDVFGAPCLIKGKPLIEVDGEAFRLYKYYDVIVNDHRKCWTHFFESRLDLHQILIRYMGKPKYSVATMCYHPYAREKGRRGARSRHARSMEDFDAKSARRCAKMKLHKLIETGDYDSM